MRDIKKEVDGVVPPTSLCSIRQLCGCIKFFVVCIV